MLNPVTAAATRMQLAETDEAVLAFAVTSREPDRDVPADELAWWLMRQERMERRAVRPRTALCWLHHRAYDTGRLELLPYLEPRWRAEIAHAVMHLGLIGAYRRLSEHG